MQLRQLDPRLVEMYRGVGKVLSTYRSGKIPKAFKMIPKLVNWEQVRWLCLWINFFKEKDSLHIKNHLAEDKRVGRRIQVLMLRGRAKLGRR